MANDKTDIVTQNQDTPELVTGQIGNFWAEVVHVWRDGFMGVDIGNILVALGIFSIFLVLRGVLSKYILHTIHLWTKKSSTDIDDKIIEALLPPIRFVPIIMGLFFAAQALGFDGVIAEFLTRLIRSMIAFTIFWALHRSLDPIQHLSKKMEKLLTKVMMVWIFKFLKVLVFFIGSAVILEIWGIAIGPLLGGVGLFGVAIALGAQDLFKNLIGGLTVIAEKRFYPGDWIKVDGIVEGTVEEIGFRSTRIRRFDKAPVYVPNSDLSDAVVINFSRMTNRRIYWKIGVTYSTTREQLTLIRDEIANYLATNDAFEKPPKVSTFVRLDSFNESSIDFMIYCFTKTTNWGEWLGIKEEFALEIKDIVEKRAGTNFAFPSQSIYLESMPSDAPEIFTPPTKTPNKSTAAKPNKTKAVKKVSTTKKKKAS
ncbi:MAG: mechanosensitive ion channel protein MscS [Zetaproteobacteria bacterium]|nr:MAG: mechanosensitive ion channel protein MscS [Zetaproteobacteria bacterium]